MKRQGKNLRLVREPALLAELAGAILRELVAQVLVLLRALLSVLLLVRLGLLPRGSLLRAREKERVSPNKSNAIKAWANKLRGQGRGRQG